MSKDYVSYSMIDDYNLYEIYFTKFKNRNKKKGEDNNSIETHNLGKLAVILYSKLMIYLFYFICLSECKQKKLFFNNSIIQLKIEGYGNIKILSDNFNNLPKIIYIDGINKTVEREHDFKNSKNNIHNVSMIWYDSLYPGVSNMFKGCSNIIEIDFINFNVSCITDTSYMFEGCSSLTHLNLPIFKECQLKNVNNMFQNCSSLKSLDLSNFEVCGVTSFTDVFSGCSSLKYLDLSNFNTSKATSFSNVFFGCASLEFINLKSAFLEEKIAKEIMKLPSPYLTICNISEIMNKYFKTNRKIFCYNISFYKATNENDLLKCYSKQISNELSNQFCEICGNNYSLIYNDENKNNSDIICYQPSLGFYFDTIDFEYKQCFSSCLSCEIGGNETIHNCIECKRDYNFMSIEIIYKNCYNENFYAENYEIISNSNDDIINDSSTYNIKTDLMNDSFFYNANINMISISDEIYNYTFPSISINAVKVVSTEEIIQNNLMNETIEDIINILLDNLNLTEIDNGNDKKANKSNFEFIFTSTNNQKNNKEKYNITMDLGQCENNLKGNYGISDNDSLYILQIIYEEEGMKIPKIEYEIYYPLNNTMTKLNLSSCEGTKIEILIKVEINDTLDKYDPYSKYYNDICSRATSDSGTDINLHDRKNEFINNNMSLCEENCKLINYNYTSKKAKCSCDIKLEIPEKYDIKFNKDDFLKSFTDIKNIINLNIMKCYRIILKIRDLRNNYGCLIISSILFFYFITLIIFCCCSFNKLKREIKQIILELNGSGPLQMKNYQKIQIKKEINKNKRKKIENHLNKSKNQNDSRNKRQNKKLIYQSIKTKSYGYLLSSMSQVKESTKNFKYKINLSNKNALKLNDFEINSLAYEEALLLDKRGYFECYFSLLKNNHPLIFSFIPINDYNVLIIKMFLFFYSFGLDLTINTLFFNDNTMHKIYEDKGEYNFLYQIPQILLSTLISKIIDSIIRPLALSQDNIVQIKHIKNNKYLYTKYNKLISTLKIKFTFFFIISFIVLCFFLYYITCFCGVYVNTQIHLIKDTFISFIIGLLYPLGMFLIPTLLRISALKIKKSNGKCIYKLSSLIENIFC